MAVTGEPSRMSRTFLGEDYKRHLKVSRRGASPFFIRIHWHLETLKKLIRHLPPPPEQTHTVPLSTENDDDMDTDRKKGTSSLSTQAPTIKTHKRSDSNSTKGTTDRAGHRTPEPKIVAPAQVDSPGSRKGDLNGAGGWSTTKR
jgi:hypothetical protein